MFSYSISDIGSFIISFLIILLIVVFGIIFLLTKPKPEKKCDRCGKMTSDWNTIEDPLYEWGDHQFLTVCNNCL